jgi:hypothetical protein
MNRQKQHQVKAAELASELASPRPMRKGWVGERWMKCGQKGCACHQDEKARHGPYFTMATPGGGNGKTISRYISPEMVPLVRKQILAMKEFRKNVKALMQAAEQWADAELEEAQAASEGAAKKGASKPPSRRRSGPKSRR